MCNGLFPLSFSLILLDLDCYLHCCATDLETKMAANAWKSSHHFSNLQVKQILGTMIFHEGMDLHSRIHVPAQLQRYTSVA